MDENENLHFYLSHCKHMFCKTCTKLNEKIISCKNYNANFIKGCINFCKSTVIEHAKSEMHMKSLEHHKTENTKESSQAFFTKITIAAAAGTAIGDSHKKMGQMSNIQWEGIEKLFRIAYFITSKGCLYTDFSDLLELEKLLEVKFVPSGSYEN